MASTDDIVENKADEYRGHVIEGSSRGECARATECDWEIDVLEEIHFELLVQYPLEQRRKDADKEEEDEDVIELTVREQTLRPNDTPLQHNIF